LSLEHLLFELPSEDVLYCCAFDFVADALFIEEVIEGRACV